MNTEKKLSVVPLCKRAALTLEEAVEYTGKSKSELIKLADESEDDLVLLVGTNRILLKRKKLEEAIANAYDK